MRKSVRQIVCAFAALSSLSVWASGKPALVVSDVDDTVKITNVLDTGAAIGNGLFGESVFAGMAPLYQGLVAEQPDDSLVFLSGSPTFLAHHIAETLLLGGFPRSELRLKSWGTGEDTPAFKQRSLEELALTTDRSFILLGDDTERDPETLTAFAHAHPDRVLKIYIHQVTGRALPSGVTPFHSALEVAITEVRDGRLSSQAVERILASLLAAPADEVFPDFVLCPKNFDVPGLPLTLAPVAPMISRVISKFERICGQGR